MMILHNKMFFGKNDEILSYKVLQKSNIFNQNLEKLKKTSSFFLHFTKLISVLIKINFFDKFVD